jgi:hypothetical protein
VSPTTENRAVTPLRRPNVNYRKREHLTADEVEALMTAAKGNRRGHRDATMVLLAYRHGLRACELVDLEWSQVDFKASVLHVRRAKKGTPATHPLRGDELRALRKLQRESPASSFVFVTERGSPFTTAGFAKMIERAGVEAGFDFKAHPHMLRHACGFALANAGHDTRARRRILGTATFSTRCATLSWRRTGSRIFGGRESGGRMSSRRERVKAVGWRAAAEVRTARADENARKLAPIIKAIQAQGITTLNGIAAALNGRRVPTPRGRGKWEATQVARVLKRLAG